MILLLLYVLFGGMTLFILGSYVDEINGDGVALCHLSEDFCLWIRVAFSSVVVSILLLVSCNFLCIINSFVDNYNVYSHLLLVCHVMYASSNFASTAKSIYNSCLFSQGLYILLSLLLGLQIIIIITSSEQ